MSDDSGSEINVEFSAEQKHHKSAPFASSNLVSKGISKGEKIKRFYFSENCYSIRSKMLDVPKENEQT